MKMKILIAATAVALSAMTGSAFAADAKGYNGSYCKAYFGSQTSNFNTTHVGITNITSGTRTVICPVVQDSVPNTSGTSRIHVYVSGFGNFRCSFFSKNPNGSIRQSRGAGRVNTGWITIPNITSDHFWGSYTLVCVLPSRTSLRTVWVQERE